MGIVADLVAHVVHEHVPAVDGRGAVAPRIDTQRAVVAVEVAGISVALLITVMVAGFFLAAVLDALLALTLQIDIICADDLGHVRIWPAEHASPVIRIVDLAILTCPLGWAVTGVVANQVLADGVGLLARVTRALVPCVHLAVSPGGARRTIAHVTHHGIGDATRAAVRARLGVAVRAGEFAVTTVEIRRAHTCVARLFSSTYSAILARRTVTKVHFHFTMATHITRFTVTVIVINQLHTILGTSQRARIREALIDVTFASGSDEPRWAIAFEAADLVGAAAVVVARTNHAVVDVDLAYEAESARWARATEVHDHIMTSAAVLTRIRCTVVDVELTVLSLKAYRALALVRADEVPTGRAVLTRRRIALVDLLLAVRAGITLDAVATVTIADVLAGAVVAKVFLRHAFPYGGVLARDHLHVAHLAGPAGRAVTLVLVLVLYARSLILARIVGAPVHVLVASLARVAVWTMTRVILHMIMAGSAVQARRTVALVDTILTVGTGVTGQADTSVVVDTVETLAAIHTATIGAVLVVGLTIDAGKAELTLAGVGVDVFLADRPVLAGLRQAFVDVDLAVFAVEAIHAQAGVVADAV